ncbi:flagellar hook-length control protein FliK [Oceanicola granulosus]|uniref:flagellar hook-length control protein FliK n=1 Tax=Oceanicola granulosus TaxID=252302 RepID=UPI00178C2772|nr:flagellar hook-length control protein FliK [Oceanicola granulosus]
MPLQSKAEPARQEGWQPIAAQRLEHRAGAELVASHGSPAPAIVHRLQDIQVKDRTSPTPIEQPKAARYRNSPTTSPESVSPVIGATKARVTQERLQEQHAPASASEASRLRGGPAGPILDTAASSLREVPPAQPQQVLRQPGRLMLAQLQIQQVDVANIQKRTVASAEIRNLPDHPAISYPSPLDLPRPPSPMSSPVQPAAHAQKASRQIAVAIQAVAPGTTEIQLDPRELGRVTLNVATSETGLHVVIATERPETLDLIRRHIDLLTLELRSAGGGTASFDFAGTGREAERFGRPSADAPPEAEADDDTSPPPQTAPSASSSDGVDLRI